MLHRRSATAIASARFLGWQQGLAASSCSLNRQRHHSCPLCSTNKRAGTPTPALQVCVVGALPPVRNPFTMTMARFCSWALIIGPPGSLFSERIYRKEHRRDGAMCGRIPPHREVTNWPWAASSQSMDFLFRMHAMRCTGNVVDHNTMKYLQQVRCYIDFSGLIIYAPARRISKAPTTSSFPGALFLRGHIQRDRTEPINSAAL